MQVTTIVTTLETKTEEILKYNKTLHVYIKSFPKLIVKRVALSCIFANLFNATCSFG